MISHAGIRRLVNFDGIKFRRVTEDFRRGKLLINFPRKNLCCWIFFRERFKLVQKPVVKLIKDAFKLRFKNSKVNQHSELVEFITANDCDNFPIMPVQASTFALVAANKMRRLKCSADFYFIQVISPFAKIKRSVTGKQSANH